MHHCPSAASTRLRIFWRRLQRRYPANGLILTHAFSGQILYPWPSPCLCSIIPDHLHVSCGVSAVSSFDSNPYGLPVHGEPLPFTGYRVGVHGSHSIAPRMQGSNRITGQRAKILRNTGERAMMHFAGLSNSSVGFTGDLRTADKFPERLL